MGDSMRSTKTMRRPRKAGDRSRDKVLAVLQATEERGRPPSVREIADATGLSPSGVSHHLAWLEDEGKLTRARGTRGITLAKGGS